MKGRFMEMPYAVLMYLLTALLAVQSIAMAEEDSFSNAGTEFVVSFKQLPDTRAPRGVLYITTPENHAVEFSVSDGEISVNRIVDSTEAITMDVADTFGDLERALYISSNDEVSTLIVMALAAHLNDVSGDTFTVFPIHQYPSYTYFAVSTEILDIGEINEYLSFIMLVGAEDNTLITVTPTQNLPSFQCNAGEECSFNINNLETQLLFNVHDLTGTKITSDKPISVFSGHKCAPVPEGLSGNCERLIEQIPPVVTWGKTFLVGPLLGRYSAEIYKIISSESDTNIYIYCGEYSNYHHLDEEGASKTLSFENYYRSCTIQADKPVLLTLFAPNELHSGKVDGAFMSIVPPVEQYTNSVVLTLPDLNGKTNTNKSVTIFVPSPDLEYSIIIDGSSITNISQMAEPIYCGELCGYAFLVNITSAGVHTLELSDPNGRFGAIAYAFHNDGFSYGSVAGMNLHHIVVKDPSVVVNHEGSLIVGSRVELKCQAEISENLTTGNKISVQWLRGELTVAGPTFDSYEIVHVFDPLSLGDSGMYVCEVTVVNSNFPTGVLASASESTYITVTDAIYIQLLFKLGAGKCSDSVAGDIEQSAYILGEEVARIIAGECHCDFTSQYIDIPTLQCPPQDKEPSPSELLFRARVLESEINFTDLLKHLEAATNKTFRFKGTVVTIGSDKDCSLLIDNIADPNTCFSTDDALNTPDTGANSNDSTLSSNMPVIIAAIVPSCIAVIFLVLLIVVSLVLGRRNRVDVTSQRPKSIHLHHRMGSGGESVTSFCPDSGSNSSTIYIPKESNPSSPTTRVSFAAINHYQHQNGVGMHTNQEQEQEQDYETMKTDLSKIQLPSVSYSDV